MIKGIKALFSSGLILNPMVLMGIILAFFCMIRMDAEQMKVLFSDYHFYILVAIISFAYSFLFKKTYKEGGIEIDYVTTIISALVGIVRFVLACGMTISFIIMLGF